MRLNDTGRLIVDGWEWLAARHQYVELDAYVVMPNHLHGVIVLTADRDADHRRGGSSPRVVPRRGGSRTAPTPRKSLSRLVGAFKTVTTKQVNLARGTPGQTLWQRNYYEHVIRNDKEWNRVREYIANNPLRWEMDAENPDANPGRPPYGP